MTSFRPNHVDVISMGCSKNLVDSQRLMKMLEAKGYSLSHDSEEIRGEYVVVNTCGFIGDAKEESIDLLLRLGTLKEEGKIGKIVVMGCLSERYRKELTAEMPEIDCIYGKFDWLEFVRSLPNNKGNREPKQWERILTGNPWSAYLKISEGCNRFCAFCAIPLITGRHKSRPIEEIEEETRQLVKEGVKEFNIIAQDLSSYGVDLYDRHALAELIDRLAQIPGVEWLRLHYAYPTDFPYDILPVMAKHANVCKYIDIALQHISDSVLGNMRRHFSGSQTRELIARIRKEVPGIKIRTTMMVGFPGETEEDFQELMDYITEARFDRLGAFAYSEEEGTFAAIHLEDNISEDEKQLRLERLMMQQEDIATELAKEMVGSRQKVLVERVSEGKAFGRTEFDSPEVDPEIIFSFPSDYFLKPGDFVFVNVTDTDGFDLLGELAIS